MLFVRLATHVSQSFAQKGLMVLFGTIKRNDRFHSGVQCLSLVGCFPLLYHHLLGNFLLLLVHVPNRRPILTFAFIVWVMHLCPRYHQLLVSYDSWIEFYQQRFCMVLDSSIGRIWGFPSCVSHNASSNSLHFFKTELRAGIGEGQERKTNVRPNDELKRSF